MILLDDCIPVSNYGFDRDRQDKQFLHQCAMSIVEADECEWQGLIFDWIIAHTPGGKHYVEGMNIPIFLLNSAEDYAAGWKTAMESVNAGL